MCGSGARAVAGGSVESLFFLPRRLVNLGCLAQTASRGGGVRRAGVGQMEGGGKVAALGI